MKKDNINNKLAITGIIVFILYNIYNSFAPIPIKLLGLDYNKLNLTVKTIYLIVYELVFITILYFVYLDKFKNDFINYIKNIKKYTKQYIEYWVLAFGLMILANLIINFYFPNSNANNQEAIVSIFKIAPIYMIVSAVIFAPLLEETVFRLGFRNMFKNDYVFIFMSGLIFGSMHVIGSFNSFMDLLYIIPYSIPGFVFAYTLVKSKNIFVPISLHFFHNGFMMLLQIILLFLM